MSHTRHRSKRPKTKHHRRIPPETKELIIQMRAMGMTYNQIADKTCIGYASIENTCTKWAQSNPEPVKAARARALEALAERVNEKAVLALEHITPDSLTHDRVEHYDAEGKLVGVSHSGPTGQQIALTAGILLDKATGLEQKAIAMRGGTPLEYTPDSFAKLLDSISSRVTRLTQINTTADLSGIQARIVEFKNAVPDHSIPEDYVVVEDAEETD